MNPAQVVTALAALGQETRLEVFRLLVQRGPNGLAAGAIAQALDLPPSSLTFHLQQLTVLDGLQSTVYSLIFDLTYPSQL